MYLIVEAEAAKYPLPLLPSYCSHCIALDTNSLFSIRNVKIYVLIHGSRNVMSRTLGAGKAVISLVRKSISSHARLYSILFYSILVSSDLLIVPGTSSATESLTPVDVVTMRQNEPPPTATATATAIENPRTTASTPSQQYVDKILDDTQFREQRQNDCTVVIVGRSFFLAP